MNTSSLTSQLNNFVVTSFDENDREILLKLAEIYIRTLSFVDGQFATSGELNLDLILQLLRIGDDHRARTASTIVKYIDPTGIVEYSSGRGRRKTELVLKNFDTLVSACFALRNERAKLVQRFSAKCTALFVQMFVSHTQRFQELQEELTRTDTQKRVMENNFEQVRDLHAWTRILNYRGIAGGSFTKDSRRGTRMKALVKFLRRQGQIEWISRKPYFKSEEHYLDSRDSIQAWQL